MSQVPGIDLFEKIDIKIENISETDLDKAALFAGGYEQIFSKRARKFRSEGWHQKKLSESEYRTLMLKEYTFLKRPVFFIDDRIYIGNTKKNIESLIDDLNESTKS